MMLNLVDSGKNINLDDISAFEKKIRIVLPNDYKLFLTKTNGGHPNISQFEFTGVDGLSNSTIIKTFFSVEGKSAIDLETNLRFYADSERIPVEVIPIAEDIAGNLICIDVSKKSNGRVYFWDHELESEYEGQENLALISLSFGEFIDLLHEEL